MYEPRLNRRLLLESPLRIEDGAGGYREDWVVLGTHWADVNARTGRERAEGGGSLSAVSYKIVVRSAPYGSPARPMPEQRFREGTRLFVIQAVAERDPEGCYLTCFADEEVAT